MNEKGKLIMLVDAKKLKAVKFLSMLDQLYIDILGAEPNTMEPNSLVVFTQFADLIDDNTEQNIRNLFEGTIDLAWTIQENRTSVPFYSQGIAVFIIYLLKRHCNRLKADWPLEWRLLSAVATNIGVSLREGD
jgi:hypothetical protein